MPVSASYQGNIRKLTAPWMKSDKKIGCKQIITILYDEDSLTKRKGRNKGIGSCRQDENLIIITKEPSAAC